MSILGLRNVHLTKDEYATSDDAMQVIARMPYNSLVILAGLLKGDAFHFSEAVNLYMKNERARTGLVKPEVSDSLDETTP